MTHCKPIAMTDDWEIIETTRKVRPDGDGWEPIGVLANGRLVWRRRRGTRSISPPEDPDERFMRPKRRLRTPGHRRVDLASMG